MAKVKLYNLEGKAVGDQELDDAIFAVPVKNDLVHQVVVAQQANSRETVAHTKDRSEVRGGGRKPWRQKGTGRARAGSTRSPIWKGGGVTFGPRNTRNFSKKINKKMKTKALFMVLSDKVKHDKLVVVDNLEIKEGKTKTLKEVMKKLPTSTNPSLFATAKKITHLNNAAKNAPELGVIAADSLNVVDIMKYDYLVIDQAGLEKIKTVFA